MKILLVNNIFPPGFIGGYELGAFDVVRALSARGHIVQVLTSDYFLDDSCELSDFHVERSLDCTSISHEIIAPCIVERRGHLFNYNNIRKLGSAMRTLDPDVVALFNIHGLGAVAILHFLEKCGIPTILYLMDNVFSGLDRESVPFKKFASIFGELQSGNSLKIIAMSQNLINEVSNTVGLEVGAVTYIPGWTDVDVVASPTAHGPGEHVRFVFSSRVASHKGIDIVLAATEELVRRGVTEFSVDVFGAGQVAQLLQKVRTKRLDRHIRYAGCPKKSDMLQLFSQYDALLFPTWEREAFGFVVSEAASAGCFPIMTAGIGASEWFLDGVDCMKIARTPDGVMSAMLRTVSMTVAERMQLRSSAMRTARLHLSFGRWIHEIEMICIEMQKEKSKYFIESSFGIQSAFLFLGHMWKESLAELPARNHTG